MPASGSAGSDHTTVQSHSRRVGSIQSRRSAMPETLAPALQPAAHLPRDLLLRVALGQDLSFVVRPQATRHADLDLGPAVAEIHRQANEGEPVAVPQLAHSAGDL